MWTSVLLQLLACVSVIYGYNYEYMTEDCGSPTSPVHINLTMEPFTYGYVRLVRTGGYPANLDCTTYLWAPDHHHFIIRFRKIDIYKPTGDCTDVLFLSGNQTTHTYCGSGTPTYALISTANMIKLTFRSMDHADIDGENSKIGFDLYYTAYHDGECDTTGSEFRCRRDNRCIPRELTCDGRDNCGDWSDERASVCGLPVGSIIMITLICLLIGGTCIAACVYYVVETKRPRQRGRNNSVTPRGDYSVSLHRGRVTSAMDPPPYSETLPPYTMSDETKVAPPPSYDNLTFDSTDGINMPAGGQSDPASQGQPPLNNPASQVQIPLSDPASQAPQSQSNPGSQVQPPLSDPGSQAKQHN